eukprot:gene17481-19229_t
MSFLSKFRGSGQEKEKGGKKEWIPPKLPPSSDEKIVSDRKTSGMQTVSIEKSPSLKLSDDHARKSSKTESELRIGTEEPVSQFSFLREDKDIVSDVAGNKPEASSSQDVAPSSTLSRHPKTVVAAKRAETTPRKKKTKAIRPGYGNKEPLSNEIYQKEKRSASTSSASETRSLAEEESKEEDPIPASLGIDDISSSKSEDDSSNVEGPTSSFTTSSFYETIDSGLKTQENLEISEDRKSLKKDEMEDGGDGSMSYVPLEDPNLCSDDEGLDEKDVEVVEHAQMSAALVVNLDKESDLGSDHVEETGRLKPAEVDNKAVDICDIADTQNDKCQDIDAVEEGDTGSSLCADSGVPVEIMNDLRDVLMEDNEAYAISNAVSYQLSLDQDEKTEIYLETLESREKSLRDQLESLRCSQVDTLKSIENSYSSTKTINLRIRELQEEQSLAVSKDDFGLAVELNQEIEQKQNELENLKFQHPLLDPKIMELIGNCNDCLKNQLEECTYLESEFQDIIKSEEDNLRKKVNQNDTSLTKARSKLNEEKANLDREMGHINLDKKHLEENESRLDKEIYERTKTYEDEKKNLLEQRTEILSEIEELEVRLRALRGTERDLNSKIESIDFEIGEIVLDFSPRLRNLKREKEDIAYKEDSVTSKLQHLTGLENELKEKQRQEQNFEQRCQQNIDMLTEKISLMKEIESEIGEEQVDLKSIIDVDLLRFSRNKQHERLQAEVKALADELNAENCKLTEISAQIARLKKTINDIEARIGELDKEKSLAISSRNFKAAKTITEERNSLIKDGQDNQNQLKELEDEFTRTDKIISRIKTELKDGEVVLKKNESELDERIISGLSNAISMLCTFKKRQKSSLWIMPFIDFEISTCQDIMKDIHETHNWPQPESDIFLIENPKVSENSY